MVAHVTSHRAVLAVELVHRHRLRRVHHEHDAAATATTSAVLATIATVGVDRAVDDQRVGLNEDTASRPASRILRRGNTSIGRDDYTSRRDRKTTGPTQNVRHVTDDDDHTTAGSATLAHAATTTAHDQRIVLLVVHVAAVPSLGIAALPALPAMSATSCATERLLRRMTRRDAATTGTALHIRPVKNTHNARRVDNAVDRDFARAHEDGAALHFRFGLEKDRRRDSIRHMRVTWLQEHVVVRGVGLEHRPVRQEVVVLAVSRKL